MSQLQLYCTQSWQKCEDLYPGNPQMLQTVVLHIAQHAKYLPVVH